MMTHEEALLVWQNAQAELAKAKAWHEDVNLRRDAYTNDPICIAFPDPEISDRLETERRAAYFSEAEAHARLAVAEREVSGALRQLAGGSLAEAMRLGCYVGVYLPASAVSGEAKKFRRPRDVHVVAYMHGAVLRDVRRAVASECFGRSLDSRHEGQRSAYGKALRAAEARVAELKRGAQ